MEAQLYWTRQGLGALRYNDKVSNHRFEFDNTLFLIQNYYEKADYFWAFPRMVQINKYS